MTKDQTNKMKKSIAKKRNTDDVFELFEDNY
jgi:hypothetical protein